jgi:hypothetical protein
MIHHYFLYLIQCVQKMFNFYHDVLVENETKVFWCFLQLFLTDLISQKFLDQYFSPRNGFIILNTLIRNAFLNVS